MLEINSMWLKFHGRLILPLGREILDGLHATAEEKDLHSVINYYELSFLMQKKRTTESRR